jgi:hypothetical protein
MTIGIALFLVHIDILGSAGNRNDELELIVSVLFVP